MPNGVCRRLVSRGRTLLVAGSILLSLSRPALAADELKNLLRRPASPGSIALLANHTRDPAIAQALRTALGSPSARVRSVAARVIGLGALADLLPEIKTALAAEPDADAAREQIRTLCAVGGPTHDAAILEAAKRFAPRLDGEVVRILGRVRGIEALPLYFSTLRGLSLSPADREAFFRLASRGSKDLLFAAGSLAFGREDAATWRAILDVAAEQDAVLNGAVLLQALGSRDPIFRGETAWYLAKTYRQRPPANAADVLDAVSVEKSAPAAGSDPELRFGAELLRRVLGTAPLEDEGWIACLETNPDCHLDSDFLESPLVELLTPREREAVVRRNETNMPPELRSGLARKPDEKPAQKLPDAATPGALSLRQITGLPRGVATDLIAIGGCKSTSSEHRLAVAEIEFRSDGLPRRVSLAVVPPGPKCRQVAESLFLMSTAPSDVHVPKNVPVAYVAFFDPDSLVCNEEGEVGSPASGAESPVLRVRAKVVPPNLTKRREVIYPKIARKNGQEGVSVYEAILSPTGCVRDLRLVQSSSHPLLDVTGMEAISHWQYKPATLDGVPVRVYLTVVVTFSLH